MIKIDKLNPFGRMCLSMGMIPSSYSESLTYEEQLIWFCNFLEKQVIPAINKEGEAIEELQNLYTELKTYVDDYFENLDVQEEINNKLDDMAESGQLADIIAQYLGLAGVLAFNTIAELSDALNIDNGSICYTLGQNSYNDGKGAFYKIRTITSGDVVDGFNIVALDVSETLIAERIPNYYINQINSSIISLQNDINELKGLNKKLVMIGDSYAAGYTPDGSIPSWCNYLCNYLGLTYSEQIQTALGGTGFATDTNNFNTMASALSADNDVTDVIVAGGYNDISKTRENIITGITNTVTTLKSKFPNAKIHIGFIGCSSIDEGKYFKNAWLSYVEGSSLNKVHYLTNIEIAMHDLDTLSSDNLHPNAHGQENVGKYIAQAITYGYADVTFKEIDVSSRFHMSIHNHDLIIRCTHGGFSVDIASLACNGNTYANALTSLTTYMKYNGAIEQSTWLTFYNVNNNNNICVPIIFSFGKNYMTVAILKTNSANTDFDTLTSINWLNVVDGEYKLEVMDC